MRFAFWYYIAKFGTVLFVLAVVGALFGRDGVLDETVLGAALGVIVVLCATGTVMGVLLALGKLKMKCPFCGKPGPVGGSRSEGMWMECDECGLVHGSGFLGLRLVADLEDPVFEDEPRGATSTHADDSTTEASPEE